MGIRGVETMFAQLSDCCWSPPGLGEAMLPEKSLLLGLEEGMTTS
jgi:hypothetical protein